MTDFQSNIGPMASEAAATITRHFTSHSEDALTAGIESQTAKIPSTGYLGAALGAMVVSAALNLTGKKHWSLFVGQWAAPFLLMGIYNKMVKQHGSDTGTAR